VYAGLPEEVRTMIVLALYAAADGEGGRPTLIALSGDPLIVSDFADRLLEEPPDPELGPVVAELEQGRRNALRLVADGSAAKS
jgi:hypothetical protein